MWMFQPSSTRQMRNGGVCGVEIILNYIFDGPPTIFAELKVSLIKVNSPPIQSIPTFG